MSSIPISPPRTSPSASGSPGTQLSGDEGRRRSAFPWLLGAVLLLALIPRVQHLGDVSFVFDEAFSRKMISFGFVEIWDRTSRDVHPPLYYWLLKGWASILGDSPPALRSMSVFFGVLTVLGAFLVVREAERGPARADSRSPSLGGAVALLAAALIALSPLQIAWSQQARMYALGAALAASSSWLLLRALRPGPARIADWMGYIIFAVALLYTHVFGLLTVAAQAVFAIGTGVYRGWSSKSSDRWNTLITVLIALFVVEFCFLPWLGVFLKQKQQVAASYWIPPFAWERVWNLGYEFLTIPGRDLLLSPNVDWLIMLFCAAPTVALLLFGRPGHRLIALGFMLPVAAAIGVSYFVQNVLITRYFLFAHVSMLCALALAAGHAPTRPARVLASGGVLLAASILCLLHMQLREKRAQVPGLAAAMEYLDSLREPGEPVMIGNPMLHAVVLSHVGDRRKIYVVQRGYEFPHFQGAPVMRENEYFDAERIAKIRTESIWVVERIHWNGGTWNVAMPAPWVSTQEARFQEGRRADCEIIVARYERIDRLSAPSGERENRAIPDTSAVP